MPRFLIDPAEVRNGSVLLDKKETRHALSVLRLKPGECVDLIDGKGGSYRGIVGAVTEGRLSVSLDRSGRQTETLPDITLGVAVIKPERMELLIQKACELGVRRIAPLLTDRSVVRLSADRWNAKVERWRKIVSESCKQCGRSVVPAVDEVSDLKTLLAKPDLGKILIPTLATEGQPLSAELKERPDRWLVLIGPEGDFTKKEVDWAMSQGARPVSLGSLVMRSETAALYILSAIRFVLS